MNLPAGYVARPADWDDLDGIVEVFKACDLADVGFEDPVREHVEEEWRAPTFDLTRDSRVVVAGGPIVAYGCVSGLNPMLSLEVFGRVHPDHRGRGLGAALVVWGESHARTLSPNVLVVRNGVPVEDGSASRLLERAGYVLARTFWVMTRDLTDPVEEVPEPTGVRIRPYNHAADVRPVHDALEEAFVEHWGFEPFPYDFHEGELAHTDPRLVAVAETDGGIVGAAIAKAVEGTGWVDVVGVRAPWRGRGVARALLLREFAALAELGMPVASLNVDAENTTGATRLYESAGMRVRRAWSIFEKQAGRLG